MSVPTAASGLMLALLVAGISGCATSNEAERIDHTITRKFDALTATLKKDLRDLKSIQRAQDKRQEDLTKSVDALKTVIYANVEGMGRSYDNLDRSTKRLAESLKGEHDLQQRLLTDHQNLEGTIGSLQTAVEGLTPLATSLDQQVQRLTDILRESYKTELLGLRERLRVLENVANPAPQVRSDASEQPAQLRTPADGHKRNETKAQSH